jgi:hypothetical protein
MATEAEQPERPPDGPGSPNDTAPNRLVAAWRRLLGRRTGWFQRRHATIKEEMDEVERLILAALGPAATEAQKEFLEYRFKRRYVNAVQKAPWFGRIAGALKMTAGTAGLASAGIGALNESIRTMLVWQVTTILLGILVGALTTLDQIWKPSVRHSNYRQTERQLLKEGWDFVLKRGRYRSAHDAEARYKLFEDEVIRIDQTERTGLEESAT